MEWFWVLLLFALLFGPLIWALRKRARRETLSQGPDSLMEAYRKHFDDWPQRRP